MNALRFFIHRALCLWYQLEQRKARSDIAYAQRLQSEARRDLDRAATLEVEERLAWEQWRRVVGAR